MSKYSNLTIDQLRAALDWNEMNYAIATDYKAHGLAAAIKDKIDGLMAELSDRTKQVPAEELITADMAAMLK